MTDYEFKSVPEWETFCKENPEIRNEILGLPVERWLDYQTKNEPVASDDSKLALDSGFFEFNDEKQLVAKDAIVVSRILSERFAERLFLPKWDKEEEFSAAVYELNSICILNKDYASAFPDSIVLLHNQHKIDVICRAAKVFQSENKTGSLWHGVAVAIPYLDLEPYSLLRLLDEAMTSATIGSNGFEAYASVEKMARRQPEFSKSLLEEVEAVPHRPAFELLSNIVLGLSHTNFEEMFDVAMVWLESSMGSLASQGVYALGAFDYTVEQRCKKRRIYFDKLNEPFENKPTPVLVAIAHSIKNLLVKDDPEIVDWIRRLSEMRNPDVEAAIANLLLNKQSEFSDRPWFRKTLNNIVTASQENPNVIGNLDVVLRCVAEQDSEFVIDYIERWVLNHDYDVNDYHVPVSSMFKSTFTQLGRESLKHEEYLVTRWFLSDDNRLHRAADDLLNDLAGKIINERVDLFHLDKQVIKDIDDADAEFLMRKILGYVIDSNLLTSLVFSMVNCGNKAKKKEDLVVWAFRKFVGYNYSGAATALLNKKLKDGDKTEKRVAKNCSEKLNEYYDALEGPIPKELHPPSLRVGAYHKEIGKMVSQAKDSAMAASPLLGAIKTTRLLFGSKAAFNVGGGATQISQLTSFEHGFERSRGDTIDPLGMRYRRWIWRHEERGGNEADN